MLVLTRKAGQSLLIAESITVNVVRITGNRVTLSIDAPNSVPILRGELPRNTALGSPITASRPTLPQ
jgi:carbon storage regulator